jgi:hypothetical protein
VFEILIKSLATTYYFCVQNNIHKVYNNQIKERAMKMQIYYLISPGTEYYQGNYCKCEAQAVEKGVMNVTYGIMIDRRGRTRH